MPRKAGGARRKRRTHKLPEAAPGNDKTPRSFVFRRGHVPAAVRDLVPELRTALMPHTALRLKERKTNNIRDYVSVATQIGVTHFWILSATAKAPYLRIGRVPQGPTLNFRIVQYSLARDIRAAQRRPVILQPRHFEQPPLLVLNNFSTSGNKQSEVALMADTFRHSFPPLDINTTKLSALRRVLLVQRDPETSLVYLRHYALKVQQAGLSKPVRKMVNKRRIPKLANLADVSELMDGAPGVFSSDSEMEDTADTTVTLAQSVQNLRKGASSKVKLVEVGPRLSLELVKAQSGLCDGPVVYHRYLSKSEEQVAEDEKRLKQKKDLKRKRREDQDANVKRKQDVKKAKKERHRKNIAARVSAEQEAAKAEESHDRDEQGEESERESKGNGESEE